MTINVQTKLHIMFLKLIILYNMIMKIILKTVVLKIKKIRLFVKIAIVVILKKLLSFI